MNNSTLDPVSAKTQQETFLKKTLAKKKLDRFFWLRALAESLISFIQSLPEKILNARHSNDPSVEELSTEDRLAILKTQCDYVRACYRVKIIERQRVSEDVPKHLDNEIDQLLDSYQRLRQAYKALEKGDR